MSILNPLVRLNLLPVWRRNVRVGGRSFAAVSFDRLLNLYLHRFGLMGRSGGALLRASIRPGMRVVDIGANQGLYTLLLAELVGERGRVLAFEPDPELFDVLARNCRANNVRNVDLYNCALGSASGSAVLCRSLLNAGDNSLAPSPCRDECRCSAVNVSTLDAVLAGQPVDFIKMDVQGWEWEVFSGMRNTLAANPSLGIYFEFWPYGLLRAGCEPVKLLTHLGKLGFALYECGGTRMRAIGDAEVFARGFTGRRYGNVFAERGALGSAHCPSGSARAVPGDERGAPGKAGASQLPRKPTNRISADTGRPSIPGR